MNRFLYTAKDQAGQEVSGAVAAQNEQIAVAQLHQAGYFVTEIRPELQVAPRSGPPSALQRAFHGVNSGDLAIMFREMATMIGAGMSMVRCLDVLEQNTSKPHLRAAIRSMQAGVERGQP
ncbi:MAG: type II secretion system F family protein, partial [Armatimonadota bacterium]